jgi:CheY-like chemotaxis protein
MRLQRRRWHRHRYQLVEGNIPTPFDTWITESLAVDEAAFYDYSAGQRRQGRAVAAKGTVLIAEDDRDAREEIAFYLSSLGYESLTASCDGAAMEVARQRQPDLLLADLNPPQTGGLELLRRWRSDRELRGAPILAIIAQGVEASDQAMSAGADVCLAKPLDFANLAQTLEALLGQPGRQS